MEFIRFFMEIGLLIPKPGGRYILAQAVAYPRRGREAWVIKTKHQSSGGATENNGIDFEEFIKTCRSTGARLSSPYPPRLRGPSRARHSLG